MEGITYGKETTGGILFSKRSDPPAGGKAGKGGGSGFSGKQIVLFCTSGGSGLGDTEKRLKPLCDPTVQWFPGKRWNAGVSEDELKAWVESLGCV